MSKRLQVLLDERDFDELRAFAERDRVTVAEWVRRALGEAKRRQASGDPGRKIAAIRAAAGHAFPTGDIDSMLAEIARGVSSGAAVPPPLDIGGPRS